MYLMVIIVYQEETFTKVMLNQPGYINPRTGKVFLKIRGRNRKGQIQNRMCNLDQQYPINSNNRSEVIWNCNEDGGKSISLDENSREIRATLDGKTCKLDHNPAQKGLINAEWDCSQPPLGSIKINKKSNLKI